MRLLTRLLFVHFWLLLTVNLIPDREPDALCALQESLRRNHCAEYLREKHECRYELPRLHRLLLPAGRTLQDVDLHGMADDRREVFAQVTYHPRSSAPVKKKLAALKLYGERGAHLVYFCGGTGPSPEGGVHFVSCEGVVLPWLNGDDGYAEAMFRF
jgi:hypothetical protein